MYARRRAPYLTDEPNNLAGFRALPLQETGRRVRRRQCAAVPAWSSQPSALVDPPLPPSRYRCHTLPQIPATDFQAPLAPTPDAALLQTAAKSVLIAAIRASAPIAGAGATPENVAIACLQ